MSSKRQLKKQIKNEINKIQKALKESVKPEIIDLPISKQTLIALKKYTKPDNIKTVKPHKPKNEKPKKEKEVKTKTKKEKIVTDKNRSESAKKGWETRRKNKEIKEEYEKAGYIFDVKTGEIKERETISEKPEYPNFSKIVISSFKGYVDNFASEVSYIFINWINELIRQYGEDDVADMLETAKQAGVFPSWEHASDAPMATKLIAEMMDYLPDASEWFKNELVEKFEYGEDWEEPT